MDAAKEITQGVEAQIDAKTPNKLGDIPMAEEILGKALAQLPAGQNQLKKLAEDAAADLIAKGKEAGKEWVEQRIAKIGDDFEKSFEQYALSPEQQKAAIGALAAYLDVKYSQADQTAVVAIHNLGKNLGITTTVQGDNTSTTLEAGHGSVTVKTSGWKEITSVEVDAGKTSIGVTTEGKPGISASWRGEKVAAGWRTQVDGAAEAAFEAFGTRVTASGNLREGTVDSVSLQTELGALAVDAAAVNIGTNKAQYAASVGVDLPGPQELSLYGSGGPGEGASFGAQYKTEVAGQTVNLKTAVDPHGYVTTEVSLDTVAGTVSAGYNTKTDQVTTGFTKKF